MTQQQIITNNLVVADGKLFELLATDISARHTVLCTELHTNQLITATCFSEPMCMRISEEKELPASVQQPESIDSNYIISISAIIESQGQLVRQHVVQSKYN